MISDIIVVNTEIIPNKLICNGSLYNIILNNQLYTIRKYAIFKNEFGYIDKILILNSKHPNLDPVTQEFCIPNTIKQINVINDETLNIIENMFRIFNFESAYFLPWEDFEMEGENG